MFKPRMIIKKGDALKQESVLESQTMQAENQRQLSSEEISLRLRKPRSEAYMQAIFRLDAGGTTMNSYLYEEKARNLALFGGYTCVEVYQDCCRGIYEDGTVSVIR